MHNTNAENEAVIPIVPGGDHALAHLSDDDLLGCTRRLVGATNHILAALLTHLAEVETRGVHRTRACASLYTYCIYELRFSEDAAARRAGAARLVKRFPLLIDAIAKGELHLTGLLMIGPHLTDENHIEVIARAKFRTKKELGKLVRELHPLPGVPDSIEPIGPELTSPRSPTWQEFASSLAPSVRELPEGVRPADWLEHAAPQFDVAQAPETPPPELPPLTAPQQYHVHFTANEEYVKLVERAKALAQPAANQSLADLHVEAMRLLVASLEKEKFAVTSQPRRASVAEPAEPPRRRVRNVLRPFAAPSPFVTTAAAHSSTNEACAVVKPPRSTFIISIRSAKAGCTPWRISRSTAVHITSWPPNRTLVAYTCRRTRRKAGTPRCVPRGRAERREVRWHFSSSRRCHPLRLAPAPPSPPAAVQLVGVVHKHS